MDLWWNIGTNSVCNEASKSEYGDGTRRANPLQKPSLQPTIAKVVRFYQGYPGKYDPET